MESQASVEFVLQGPARGFQGKRFKAYNASDIPFKFRMAIMEATAACSSSRLHLKLFLRKFRTISAVVCLERVLQIHAPVVESIHVLLEECILSRACVEIFMSLIESMDKSGRIRRITLRSVGQDNYGAFLNVMKTKQNTTPFLKHINICDMYVYKKEEDCIAELLQCNLSIHYLSMECCNMSPDSLQRICQAAWNNPSLRSLALSGNHLSTNLHGNPDGLEQVLLQNPKITSLDITDSQRWGSKFAELMAKDLRRNTTLRSLTISEDFLQDDGPTSLAASLANGNHSLSELKVKTCVRFRAQNTARGLSEIVSSNTCLRKLSLELNSDHVVVETLDALSDNRNTTLQEISIHPMSGDIANALTKFLVSNQTLEAVTLGWSFVTAMVNINIRQRILQGLRSNHSITHFSVALYHTEWDGFSEARFYTDRNRIDRFLRMSSEKKTPRLWLYGLERASSASPSALFYYIRETSDILESVTPTEGHGALF